MESLSEAFKSIREGIENTETYSLLQTKDLFISILRNLESLSDNVSDNTKSINEDNGQQ